jgi:hypothetical protein
MCEVCNGAPFCPCCGKEPEYEDCHYCDGEGLLYYNEFDLMISKGQFNGLQPSERYSERCDNCNGEGKIEV